MCNVDCQNWAFAYSAISVSIKEAKLCFNI